MEKVKFMSVDEIKQEEKTIFTHYLDTQKGWCDTKTTPNCKNIIRVIYLGKCTRDGDMFAVYYKVGSICIYKGVKGGEFNQ